MKKFLMTLALALALSSTAMAAAPPAVDVSGLTAEQVADLVTKAAAMKKEPVNVSAVVRSEAEAWGTLGANMGRAMVGAAREVGVAANDFAGTDLGKITVALVAYKLVGRDLLGVIVGSGILFAGFAVLWYLLTTKRMGTVEYEYKPVLFGLWQKQVVKTYEISDDAILARVMACFVVIIVTLIAGLKTMF